MASDSVALDEAADLPQRRGGRKGAVAGGEIDGEGKVPAQGAQARGEVLADPRLEETLEGGAGAGQMSPVQGPIEDAGWGGHGASGGLLQSAWVCKGGRGERARMSLLELTNLGRVTSLSRQAARSVIDMILPPRALDEQGSRARPMLSAGVSAAAWSRIAFIDAPFCDACGAPFEYAQGEAALCPACLAQRPVFARARAACLYDEHSRDLILQLKHADRTDLAGLFARRLARAAADILAQSDAVLPVPLHRWRLLRRRYNQAAEIARPLAGQAALPYFADALVRTRATPSQSGRSGGGRRRNVAGAFAVPPRWRRRIDGARLLIVDDVLTTGATVEACARTLKSAGAAEVNVAVIARVRQRILE